MADGGGTPERGSVTRDRESLCALFDATNIAKPGQTDAAGNEILQDGWNFKEGWKSSRPMGEWHGVTTNAEGRVIGLKLDQNGLAGNIPPKLGDLDALEKLDMSYNGLDGGIPKELGKLRALKRLYLTRNYLIGVIPPEIGGLTCLEELKLQVNRLTGGIPKELGNLLAIKLLDLSDNLLGGVIPPELGGLNALKDLHLGVNEIQGSIPPELGNLRALVYLNLPRNCLDGTIPPDLGKIVDLSTLDLSDNQLTGCVPPQLGNLKALRTLCLNNNKLTGLWDHTQAASLAQESQGLSDGSFPRQLRRFLAFLREVATRIGRFDLDGNPWAEPPEAVVNSGISAVTAYFSDLYSSPCRARRKSVKVVLVGHEGAGKTSLRQSMKTGQATPTDGSVESTVLADVATFDVNGVSVRVYDCAGQVAYTGLLQMFLTPRAVCLVVCDAGAFWQRGSRADDQLQKDIASLERLRVCEWMRSISQRVPRSDVILVATKCDLAGGNAAGIARRIDAACRAWLEGWVKAVMAPVRLEDGVCLTSCVATAQEEQGNPTSSSLGLGKAWECDWRDDMADELQPSMLHRIVSKRDGLGVRGAEMVLPNSWDIALTVLEALELGGDPVEAVVQRSAETQGGLESKPEPFKGITTEELRSKWQTAVAGLSRQGISVTNPDRALEGALSIRDFEGTIVRHETFVFLDVIWLTRILKPLLNHKDTELFNGDISLGDTADTCITLIDDGHIESWTRLKKEGILEPELARIMWPDLFEYVLPTLESLGLTFPLERDPEEGLVVLLRLGTVRPDSVGEDIDAFRSEHSAVLEVRWDMFLGVPPGAIEKVLTRCCSIGGVQTFWRFGVLVRGAIRDREGGGIFALVLEYSPNSNQLDMKVYGDICKVAPWAAFAYAISAVRTMAMEFPGLRSRANFKCPEHGEEFGFIVKASRPGEKLLSDRGCHRCSHETGDMGAAAGELVRMLDVRQDRDVVFNEMEASFAGLQRKYTVLRPAMRVECIPPLDMEEDRKTVLRSVVASATSGPCGRDGPYQDWVNLQRKVEGMKGPWGDDTQDGLGVLETKIMGSLDFVQRMVMAERRENTDVPRHACLLPGDYAEPHGLSDELRKPEVWTRKLKEWCDSDFKAGKGVWKKKFRLFLVCAHTHQLVPCGHDGRGYDVQRVRKWACVMLDVARLALQVTISTLLSATLVGQLPINMLGAVGERTLEAALSGIQRRLEALGLDDDDGRATEALREENQYLKGTAYEHLRTVVHGLEDTALYNTGKAKKKAHKKGHAPPSVAKFVYFKQVMARVQARTGDGEAQWVLKGREQAWLDAA